MEITLAWFKLIAKAVPARPIHVLPSKQFEIWAIDRALHETMNFIRLRAMLARSLDTEHGVDAAIDEVAWRAWSSTQQQVLMDHAEIETMAEIDELSQTAWVLYSNPHPSRIAIACFIIVAGHHINTNASLRATLRDRQPLDIWQRQSCVMRVTAASRTGHFENMATADRSGCHDISVA